MALNNVNCTQWTLIYSAQGQGPAARDALGRLLHAYQRTIRYHVGRWRLPRNVEVDDVVQDFFHAIVRSGDIHRVGPDHGKFRHWLAACVDNHMRNQWRHWSALRRGNHQTVAFDNSPAVASDGWRPNGGRQDTLDSYTNWGGARNPFRESAALSELLRAEALDICDEAVRRMAARRRKPQQFALVARLLPGRQLNQEPLCKVAAQLGMSEATLRDKLNDLRAEFGRTICGVLADGLHVTAGHDPLLCPDVRRELEDLYQALSYTASPHPLGIAEETAATRSPPRATYRGSV